MRRIGPAVLVVFSLLAVACNSPEDTPEKVGDSSTGSTDTLVTPTTVEPPSKVFRIGENVGIGDYEVVVYSVKDPMPSPSEYIDPGPGKRFVGLDTEVTNRTTTARHFSPRESFTLQDQANRVYGLSLRGSLSDPGPPDGEIGPRGAKRGMVVFEVPPEAVSLRLVFDADAFGTGQAVIKLT